MLACDMMDHDQSPFSYLTLFIFFIFHSTFQKRSENFKLDIEREREKIESKKKEMQVVPLFDTELHFPSPSSKTSLSRFFFFPEPKHSINFIIFFFVHNAGNSIAQIATASLLL